ncbi:MAG: Ig-like domain-containing protein [Eubacterium sp.]
MKNRLCKKELINKFMAVIMMIVMITGVYNVYSGENWEAQAATDAFEQSISGFPDSYKTYLRSLHKKYPNWKFVPYKTGISFATAVSKEYEGNRSLIENAYSKYLKSNASSDYNVSTGKYIAKDGSSWVTAAQNCIAYFMDPRNFLDDSHIYMFEQLSFDAATQTQAGVEAILQGSFMYKTNIGYITTAGKYQTSTTLYSKQILDAAKQTKVSAYYLASKILQEIGTSKNSKYAGMGASGSVSGTYSKTYTGIYNFYNIGATSSANPIANGLSWAKSGTTYLRPWNTPFKSITGGAQYIGEKYINCGQNTTYFQRFNVNKNSTYALYTHQYMTNIYGAASEASSTSDAYNSLGITSLAKTFVIPVYENMPNENNTIKVGSSATKSARVTSSVNVRKGPSTEYGTLVTLDKDDGVTVTEGVMTTVSFGTRWLNNPYWYKITVKKNGKSYTGYVSAAYITFNKELDVIKNGKVKLPVTLGTSETIYYMSEDPAIATVDASGNITGKKDGTTTIMAFTSGGKFSATGVQVFSKGCTIDVSSLTLAVGSKKTLKTTVYPTNSANKTVTYSSSNKSVAKVSAKGKITAKAAGTAKITVKAAIGGVTASCNVKVIPKKVVLTAAASGSSAVKLSWAYTSNISGYLIYKKNSSGKYKKIATAKGAATSYIDKNLAGGETHSYKVKAYTLVGKTKYKSKKSSAVSVTLPVAKTKIKSATSVNTGIKLKWKAVAGASGYRVYRSDSLNGTYKRIKKIKSGLKLKYTDKNVIKGRTYYYKIRAYKTINGKNVYGKYSKKISVKRK